MAFKILHIFAMVGFNMKNLGSDMTACGKQIVFTGISYCIFFFCLLLVLAVNYSFCLCYQEVIPLINWERNKFSTPVLAVLIFASVALFPTLLLPSSPSMWVAGMTFGYGFGFLLIISAATVGVSLPFFIGSIFHHKIQVLVLFLILAAFGFYYSLCLFSFLFTFAN